MKNNRITWIRLFTLLFGIFIGLVILGADSNTLPEWIIDVYHYPNGDKIGHFFLYGMLAFFLVLSFPKIRLVFFSRQLPLGSVLLACFATLEEISQ